MKPKLRWVDIVKGVDVGNANKQNGAILKFGFTELGEVGLLYGKWTCWSCALGRFEATENTRESAMAELERVTREMLREAAGE